MNWPLVSRRAYEAALAEAEQGRGVAKRGHEFLTGELTAERARMRELREQRDYFRDRTEALTADLLAMRRDGFSVAKVATVRESPDDEANGLHRAEAALVLRAADVEFITRATRDIMQKTGVSEAQARAEAIRLRRAVTDEDPPT
jgi:hypothetical protein